ncbi:MAG: glycosyltransferase family 2 protein [Candidatus Lokiarchaeia archaeon]
MANSSPPTRAGKPKIFAVIPARNEEQTVGIVVKETLRYVDNVLVVDDASSDHTGVTARSCGAIVTRRNICQGIGAAVSTGLCKALELGANIIVTLDADGQHDPQEIPNLIAPILSGEADLVLGSRFLGSMENPDSVKVFGNRLFTFIVKRMTRVKLTDTQSGFRAFTQKSVNSSYFSPFTYTQEMIIRAAKDGFRIKEVPVHINRRRVGNSRVVSNPIIYGFKALKIILKEFTKYYPLFVYGSLGLIILTLGLLASLFYIGNFEPFLNQIYYNFNSTLVSGIIILLVNIIGTALIIKGVRLQIK